MNPKGRAALFDSAEKAISIVEFQIPPLNPGEVLVDVLCCTICGSDLHTYSGRRSGHSPSILGHEIIGEIRDFSGATPSDYYGNPLKKGDRITWNMAVGCGECFYCQNRLPQKCVSVFKYGHEKFDGSRPTGGFASHCILVPGTTLFSIPDCLPDSIVCPANCATATVAATIRMLEEVLNPGQREIALLGMGMLGLTATAMLSSDNSRTVCVDLDPARLELATNFGATSVVQVEKGSCLSSRLLEKSLRGFDASLEFSGAASAVNASLECLRKGGTSVLVGSVFPGQSMALAAEDLVRKMLTIRGVHNYRPDDLAKALTFLHQYSASFPFEELTTARFRLDDIESAFQAASSGKHVRVIVSP